MSFAANSRAPKPDDIAQEPTGPIASDSLAAESLESEGGFADNENANALGVKGASSTLNTTDTSAASTLHPASSGAAREKEDALGAGSDERGVSGVKYPEAAGQPHFTGTHNLDGYTGGPSADRAASSGYSSKQLAGDSDFGSDTLTGSSGPDASQIHSSGVNDKPTSSSTGAGTGVRPYVDAAPTYTSTVTGAFQTEGELRPKGDHLIEGGIPQTKTFTGDVGGPHDPGRLAEQGFEKINSSAAGDNDPQQYISEGASRKPGEGNTGQYDMLESERA